MEVYEMIDLQDCPRCFGPSILEEEDHSYYVMCMDCGCQSASLGLKMMKTGLMQLKEQQNCGIAAR